MPEDPYLATIYGKGSPNAQIPEDKAPVEAQAKPAAQAEAETAGQKTPREKGRTRGGNQQDVAAEKASEAPAPTPSFEKLADAQANQYLAMTKALDPLTSGAALPSIDASMTGNAERMLGQGATSPVSEWLNAQSQAASAQFAPVAAANAQVGKAEDANSALIASGLQDMGVAETDLMHAAPYQQLLSSLASEVPYHLASGYSIPGMTQANTPAWLQQAEKNAGVSTLPAASGSSDIAKGLLPPPTASPTTSSSLTTPASSPTPQY